ncbi:hypothetical protein J6590_010879 [Homalodisca vitripennis]|nr:hypothetical protein J6590_010879 [Homalodisca vitripennis]
MVQFVGAAWRCVMGGREDVAIVETVDPKRGEQHPARTELPVHRPLSHTCAYTEGQGFSSSPQTYIRSEEWVAKSRSISRWVETFEIYKFWMSNDRPISVVLLFSFYKNKRRGRDGRERWAARAGGGGGLALAAVWLSQSRLLTFHCRGVVGRGPMAARAATERLSHWPTVRSASDLLVSKNSRGFCSFFSVR